MSTPEQFARVAGRVNLELLQTKTVVIIGVGSVGSQLAHELARAGVGRLWLVDGDDLEAANLTRHMLPSAYIGTNKAAASAHYLTDSLRVRSRFSPRFVNDAFTDAELDTLIDSADVVVAATDDRIAQRRIGRRALALDVPALFPALDRNGGGEVFAQLRPGRACFLCWDAFRDPGATVRAVSALNADVLSLIPLATHLTLGLLDPRSSFATHFSPVPGDERPRNLFVLGQFAGLQHGVVARRPGCPACGVGPSPLRAQPAPAPGGNMRTPAQGTTSREPASSPPSDHTVITVSAIVVAGLVVLAVWLIFGHDSASDRAATVAATQPGVEWAVDGSRVGTYPTDDATGDSICTHLSRGVLSFDGVDGRTVYFDARTGKYLRSVDKWWGDYSDGGCPTRERPVNAGALRTSARVGSIKFEHQVCRTLDGDASRYVVLQRSDGSQAWKRSIGCKEGSTYRADAVALTPTLTVISVTRLNFELRNHSRLVALRTTTGERAWSVRLTHGVSTVLGTGRFRLLHLARRYVGLDMETGHLSKFDLPRDFTADQAMGLGGPQHRFAIIKGYNDLGYVDFLVDLAVGTASRAAAWYPTDGSIIPLADAHRVVVLSKVPRKDSDDPAGYVLRDETWQAVLRGA